jgi:hypothetical protein
MLSSDLRNFPRPREVFYILHGMHARSGIERFELRTDRVVSCRRHMPGEYHTTESRPASLEQETRTVIEEARMVLPGIQAVFGFQLIAVFNNGFHDLKPPEQLLHLGALLLVVIAIALIMTPASYHRITERGIVSQRFVEIASRLLALAMLPLMLGLTLDLFVVSRLILNDVAISIGIVAVLVIMFFGLWYVFPWIERRLLDRALK